MFCTAVIIRIKLVYFTTKMCKLHYHILVAKLKMRFGMYVYDSRACVK